MPFYVISMVLLDKQILIRFIFQNRTVRKMTGFVHSTKQPMIPNNSKTPLIVRLKSHFLQFQFKDNYTVCITSCLIFCEYTKHTISGRYMSWAKCLATHFTQFFSPIIFILKFVLDAFLIGETVALC